jgi:hypothetical protein
MVGSGARGLNRITPERIGIMNGVIDRAARIEKREKSRQTCFFTGFTGAVIYKGRSMYV